MNFYISNKKLITKKNKIENTDIFYLDTLTEDDESVCLGHSINVRDFLISIKASLSQLKDVIIIGSNFSGEEKLNPNVFKSKHLELNETYIYLSPSVRKKIKPECNDKLLNLGQLKVLLNQQLSQYLTK